MANPDATMKQTVNGMSTTDAQTMENELNALSSSQLGGLDGDEAALLALLETKLGH